MIQYDILNSLWSEQKLNMYIKVNMNRSLIFISNLFSVQMS